MINTPRPTCRECVHGEWEIDRPVWCNFHHEGIFNPDDTCPSAERSVMSSHAERVARFADVINQLERSETALHNCRLYLTKLYRIHPELRELQEDCHSGLPGFVEVDE